jgi:hypothetical protein
MKEEIARVTIRIPLALKVRILRQAKSGDRTMNKQIIRLLRKGLDEDNTR